MPHPKESPDEALARLDQRLGAAEAAQARKLSPDMHAAMAQGYRFVGEVVGGVLGGVGLGWLLDRFAHTQPWGVIGGLLVGSGISIFAAVSAAAKANRKLSDVQGRAPGVADEDED
jgi:ATP synthase protein I